MSSKKGKKALLVFLDKETRSALDAMIALKRRKELFKPIECNLQTEGAAALRAWIKAEIDRLARVDPPKRIM